MNDSSLVEKKTDLWTSKNFKFFLEGKVGLHFPLKFLFTAKVYHYEIGIELPMPLPTRSAVGDTPR